MWLIGNNPPMLRRPDGIQVELLRGVGPERNRCEQELVAAGNPFPLPHRCAWSEIRQPAESWFLAIRDSAGCCRAGFAVEVRRSRALPGHFILRVERFGYSLPAPLHDVCVAALERLARDTPRVLRMHVEVFSPEEATRQTLRSSLEAHRFRQLKEGRRYGHTIGIDLRPEEAGILASFHATARRHIRAVGKNPVALRPIEDEMFVQRMEAIYRETRTRTGGPVSHGDWASVVKLSRNHPDHSRVVGLFRTDVAGPDSLLAFAWGCGHGDHAHYETAASTRHTDLRLPLAYGLVWDLVCWARRKGATWFDFGGITQGHAGSEDPLGGISDFKRYFSKNVVAVGDEWVIEPSWIRAKLASAVSGGAVWVSKIRAAVRRPGE